MSSAPFDVQIPATEQQIAESISVSDPDTADIIRRLAYERDRLREGLLHIAGHSVCCDARHCADRVLAGNPVDFE